MAFALPLNPFSAVLHTLREQGKTCRSLSCRLVTYDSPLRRTLHSSQHAARLHVALTAVKQDTREQVVVNDFHAAKTTFEQLGYDSVVCQAIKAAGLDRPSKVQVQLSSFSKSDKTEAKERSLSSFVSVPSMQDSARTEGHMQELSSKPILQGQSVGLAAQTGSGKTLAYLAPLISSLVRENRISTPGSAPSSAGYSTACILEHSAWSCMSQISTA